MGLVCSQIEVNYPEFKLSLDLKVAKGELVSIIGPSGCGKSTSLQIITGLIPTESGSIILNDKDITTTAVWERNIAMVFQDYALFPHLNVQQNVAYSLRFKKIKRKEIKERVNQMLSLVGLTGYGKRKINSLSGGERQRVALARAIASEPQLLLLDEPLSALDARMRKHLRQEIKNIHQATGITTLYVTHDQEEALTISDRVVVMQEGKIVQFDYPEVIYNKPASLFVAQFMGDGTLLPASIIEEGQIELEEKDQLFFRPEKVVVQDDLTLPFADFKKSVVFDDVLVDSYQYTGDSYLIKCKYKNHTILARCPYKPKSKNVSLSVRVEDIILF
jgi:ABC-type Fe3+/spermidine/putrescine transport system ATPase subunit